MLAPGPSIFYYYNQIVVIIAMNHYEDCRLLITLMAWIMCHHLELEICHCHINIIDIIYPQIDKASTLSFP